VVPFARSTSNAALCARSPTDLTAELLFPINRSPIPVMKRAAVFSLLDQFSELPFWAHRELTAEKSRLLVASGLPVERRFKAPPLQPVFGPGTRFPKGLAALAAAKGQGRARRRPLSAS
jgi:hypothetical protein